MAGDINCTGQKTRTKTDTLVLHFIHGLNDGAYGIGEKLPSIRALAKSNNVSRFTAVQAYDRLIARGIIESRPGSGYYFSRASNAVADRLNRTPISIDEYSTESILADVNIADGHYCPSIAWLPVDWLDADLINRGYREASRVLQATDFQGYSEPKGSLSLRTQLQVRLSMARIQADVNQIITLPSFSAALVLLGNCLFDRENTILVEEPGWHSICTILSGMGFSVRGVKMTAEGPDIDHLEEQIKRFSPKYFLVSPVIQNPTGAITSPATIHRVLQLVDKYGMTIIEDDTYSFYHSGGAVRYAELDGFENVIYIDSFSKSLSPTLRTAFLAAPTRLLHIIETNKALYGTRPAIHSEHGLRHILQSGLYDKHLNYIRQRMTQARVRADTTMKGLGLEFWHQPSYGPFLWMRHPDYEDSSVLIEKARTQKLIIAGGDMHNPRHRASPWMRFTAPYCDDKRVSDFFNRL